MASQSYVDPERIAIWGWSFGGFTTLMSMSMSKDVYKAGVAIAPVTDWRFYDTVYTERYMSVPQDNAEGYDAASPLCRAKDLSGNLLLPVRPMIMCTIPICCVISMHWWLPTSHLKCRCTPIAITVFTEEMPVRIYISVLSTSSVANFSGNVGIS